jgi:hypothetical protein
MKNEFKKYLLVGLLTVISITVAAQKSNKQYPVKIKFYLNGFSTNELYSFSSKVIIPEETFKYDNKSFSFGNMSFGLEYGKNEKIKQEIELLPFYFNQQENASEVSTNSDNNQMIIGNKITAIKSGLRYQLNYYILNNKGVNPYLGISSQLLYEHFRKDPELSPPFLFTSHDLGVLFSFTPGVEVKLCSVLSLDLNLPISFFDFKFNADSYYSPLLPEEQRTQTYLTTNLFPKRFNFRIGLSYRI